MILYFFLDFLKYFHDKYGESEPVKSNNCGSSRNDLKSIANNQETTISNFGMIQTPNTIKKQYKTGKTQTSHNLFPPLDPHIGKRSAQNNLDQGRRFGLRKTIFAATCWRLLIFPVREQYLYTFAGFKNLTENAENNRKTISKSQEKWP